MTFSVVFQEPRVDTFVETQKVQIIMGKIMLAQRRGLCSCVYGNSGVGKSSLARELTKKVENSYEKDPTNPLAFLAKHYQAGDVGAFSGQELKQGIKSLYVGTGMRLSEHDYRMKRTEELAADLAYGLHRTKVGMIFVDEAGLLSVDALRGMVMVRDVAENMGIRLSLVFIGMDQLPVSLDKLPQIRRRVSGWHYFDEYKVEETWDLLRGLHSFFAELNPKINEHQKLVQCVHDLCGGYPGYIVPFLDHFDVMLSTKDETKVVDDVFIRTVHYSIVAGRDKSIAAARDVTATRKRASGTKK